MYIYCADTYCDSCGSAIAAELSDSGLAPSDVDDERSYDSDDYPKGGFPLEATDGPDHCASVDKCLGDAVDLGDYGLEPDAELFGAECRIIGELLSSGLTEYGAEYLREMLGEPARTPYQTALHTFWTAAFADELGGY